MAAQSSQLPTLAAVAVGSALASALVTRAVLKRSVSGAAAASSQPARRQAKIMAKGGDAASTATLSTGDQLPLVGLGLWKIPRAVTAEAVLEAIKIGYRHFDGACDYGNEEEVGKGLQAAFDQGLVTREELWITSKLWNTYHAEQHVEMALDRTLQDLGLDYLDLYLVHFPIPLKFVPFETRYPPEWVHDPSADVPKMEYAPVSMQETWRAMEALTTTGKVRNIGLSNVGTVQLRDLLCYASVRPAVLQVERHVYLQQPRLKQFCDSEGIHLTAYSPLGAGSYVEMNAATDQESPLQEPVLAAIASRLGRTPAQVLLRWGVQSGTSVIPKSSKPHRLAENLDMFSFALSEEDMAALAGMDKHRRFNDPGVFSTFMNSFCPIFD